MRLLARGATAAVAIALAVPAAASAQSGFFVVDTTSPGGGGSGETAVENRLTISGSLSIDFHGDEAAGCADTGLCGVSGTVTWNPGRTGTLFGFGYRVDRVHQEEGFLGLGGDLDTRVPRTSASVRRALPGQGGPGSLCADAGSQGFSAVGSRPRTGSSLAVRLIDGGGSGILATENLRTRCAGPTASDIAGLLPTRLVPEQALRHGHRTVDFAADRTFASHGLAGTVHSTIALHLGNGQDLRESTGPPSGIRRRSLEVSYRIERVSGRVLTGFAGLADPDFCGPLDACGLTGLVTLTPQASSGAAIIGASASLRHRPSELRRAIGLSPGPRPHGVDTFGYAAWDQDVGRVRTDLQRDGRADCTDSEPLLNGGAVTISFSGGAAHAAYSGSSDGLGPDGVRTRCPGPGIRDVAPSHPLASGTVPLSAFRGSRVTLRLNRGGDYSSDGYSGTTHADVTVVLRREKIRQHVQVFRTGLRPTRLARLARLLARPAAG
jgi:hypothetical protein